MTMFANTLSSLFGRQKVPGDLAPDPDPMSQNGAYPMPQLANFGLPQMPQPSVAPQEAQGASYTLGMTPTASLGDQNAPIPLSPISLPSPDLSGAGKPGFFSSSGLGVKLLGSISDGILGANGMAPVYGPTVAARQQQNALDQRQAMQQQAETQRQLMVEAYKRAHPEPTEFEKLMTAGGYPAGSSDAIALARQKAQADAMGTPFVYEQYNPTTGATDKVISSRTSIPGMAPPAAQAGGGVAIGSVVAGHRYMGGPTNDPRSWQELGGAAPTAPSPFQTPARLPAR